jgi:hypothetical protein
MTSSLITIWNSPYEEVLEFLKQYNIQVITPIGAYIRASQKVAELGNLSPQEYDLVVDPDFQKIMLSKKNLPFHQILISGIIELVRHKTLHEFGVVDSWSNSLTVQGYTQPYTQASPSKSFAVQSSLSYNPTVKGRSQRSKHYPVPVPIKMYGQGKTFIFFTNKADGDCALHGLSVDNPNITRDDFIMMLSDEIQNDSEKSRKLKQYIRPEIVSWCFLSLNRQNCNNDEIIDEITPKYISEVLKTEYLSYAITNEGPSGTLSAAALIYNLNVKIWRGEPANLYVAAIINSNSYDDYINLYHHGDEKDPNHYDLLVEENDIKRLKRAQIKKSYGR